MVNPIIPNFSPDRYGSLLTSLSLRAAVAQCHLSDEKNKRERQLKQLSVKQLNEKQLQENTTRWKKDEGNCRCE